MDELIKVYFEDASEFLQNAEQSMIRLEQGYSEEDINELFRSAHSLKGGSSLVGFDEIASLTHKIEDMLYLVRKGSLSLDKYIINLCFEGFDIARNLITLRENRQGGSLSKDDLDISLEMENTISHVIQGQDKKEENTQSILLPTDFCSQTYSDGYAHTFFAYFVFDKEAGMHSVRMLMILAAAKEIGSICYSNPSMEMVANMTSTNDNAKYHCILRTDKSEEALYELLDVGDIEMMKLINLSDCYLEENTVQFNLKDSVFFNSFFTDFSKLAGLVFDIVRLMNSEGKPDMRIQQFLSEVIEKCVEELNVHIQQRLFMKFKEDICAFFVVLSQVISHPDKVFPNVLALMQKMYIDIFREMIHLVENKIVLRSITIQEKSQLQKLMHTTNHLDQNLFTNLLVDISPLEMIELEDIHLLIDIKKKLDAHNIRFYLINNGTHRRRLYNIFDSVCDDAVFLYYSEIEALIGFNWGKIRKYLKLGGKANVEAKL